MSSRRSSSAKRRRESFMVVESPASKRNRRSSSILPPAPEDDRFVEQESSSNDPSGGKMPMRGGQSPATKTLRQSHRQSLPRLLDKSLTPKSTGTEKKKVSKMLTSDPIEEDQAVLQQKWTYEAHNILVNRQHISKNDSPSRVDQSPSTPPAIKVPSSSSSSSIRKSIGGILSTPLPSIATSIRKSIGGILSTPLPSIATIPSSILRTPLKIKRHRQLSLVKFIFSVIIIVLVEQKFQSFFGYNRSTTKTQKAKAHVVPKKVNYDSLLRNIESRVDHVMEKVQAYTNSLCSRETASNTAEENVVEVSKELEKVDRELDNINRTLQVAKSRALSFEKNDVNYMIEVKNIKSILNHITEGMQASDKVLSDTTDLLVSLK